ncbi:MAG: hypothetical protein ACI4GZ_06055 [Ruminococcus sp.]
MKKNSSLGWIIAILSAMVAVAAAAATITILWKKKQSDNEELEEYLDNAIE